MINVEQAEHEDVSGVLRGLIVRLDDRLSARDVTFIAEFIDAGELGLALEQMADALSEDEQPITPSERADMSVLADRMKMGERVPRVLQVCPDRVD
jgi:hypothetical protein